LLAKSSVVEPKLSQLRSQLDRDIAELEASLGVQVLNLSDNSTIKSSGDNEVTVRSKASQEMPAASECVRLVHSPRFGRHLIADTDINPGTCSRHWILNILINGSR
jgi:hypothetical protein